MAESRLMTEWDQTASVLAKIHNSNARKGSVLRSPAFFHPLRRKSTPATKPAAIQLTPQQSITFLKSMLIPRPSA